MSKRKINILFVVTEFYQAGAQRSTFEMDRAIDKSIFNVEILCGRPLNTSTRWKDYYYEKHLSLGTKIYFRQDIDIVEKPGYKHRFLRKLFNHELPSEHKALLSFFERYDCISFIGEYTYPRYSKLLTSSIKKKSFIHVHNTKLQKLDNYLSFNKSDFYQFVSPFKSDQLKFEFSEFKNYNHIFFPLCFKFNDNRTQFREIKSSKKNIGIFTRLTPTKPLDPFLYAFQLLLEHYPDSRLNIFGSGDPEKEGVMKYVRHLQLHDKVVFRGHQENIVESALNHNLDLVWFHGFHGVPGGWAGYDICTTGIPQIFWNFGNPSENAKDNIFPMHHKLKDFVNESKMLLYDAQYANDLAKKQFEYVAVNHNIDLFIDNIQKMYIGQIHKNL